MNAQPITDLQSALSGMAPRIAVHSQVDAARVMQAVAELARKDDALDHIRRVCEAARQSTRRIRWIIERAKSALAGDEKWREVDIPRHDPAVEKLENMIVSVYGIAKAELAARRDLYEGEDDEIPDEQMRAEIKVLQRFVDDARHVSAAIRQAEGGN